MKRKALQLLAFFLLALSQLSAQYIPLVEEDKFWIYSVDLGGDFPAVVSSHAITFRGEVVLNSLTYKKVYRLELKGRNHCPPNQSPCFLPDVPYETESIDHISYIREDTIERKVYQLPLSGMGEELIFDFSLSLGDSLNQELFDFITTGATGTEPIGIVDSINVVDVFEKDRTVLYSTGVRNFIGLAVVQQILLIEGIGLESHGVFLRPFSTLLDFCESSMFDCHLILSEEKLEPKTKFNISPNPSKDLFHISMAEESIQSIRIYSLSGQLKQEFFNTHTLDLSDFANGIYFLELISKEKERFVKKIVKEN